MNSHPGPYTKNNLPRRQNVPPFHALSPVLCVLLFAVCTPDSIDRFSLVTRHNICHTSVDSLSSLSVGNGSFAFTADITGLQTFPESYDHGIALGTMAEWAWHVFPNEGNYSLDDVVKYYQVGTDSIPYFFQFSDTSTRQGRATAWLRENPHRIHLGLIGFTLLTSDSINATINDIKDPIQRLNLWTGEITSEFTFEGIKVRVITFCDQSSDRILASVESDLLRTGRLGLKVQFAYARHEKFNPGYDLTCPEKHRSEIIESGSDRCIIRRQLDSTVYYSRIDWDGDATVSEQKPHIYLLKPDNNRSEIKFSVSFSATPPNETNRPGFTATENLSRNAWQEFWRSGGAIDFSKCSDQRAPELERRLILSQYLTKIQCAGTYPPQETGLTFNSWHGKFHLEMHWWHGIHYLLWNRSAILERQLAYYPTIFEHAKKNAIRQGYHGVRWPKMTDPSGRESPSSIGVFLIWQQPHLIYFADLLYRSADRKNPILEKYSTLVFETADFIASYARFDSLRNEFILGPALIPAQERFAPETTINPSFELAYWSWALETAQKWREHLGLRRDASWQKVIDHLAPLPVKDSMYLFTESAPNSYTDYLTDHPMVLGLYGFLPETPKINKTILLKTQQAIIDKWHWKSCWGWDFPLAAMNAAAFNNYDLAIDLLLMDSPKNTYLMNGHNYQDGTLPIYLPGNGGLLTAAASIFLPMSNMGSSRKNKAWNVTCENMHAPCLLDD